MIELSEEKRRELETLYLRLELWRRERERCEGECQNIAAEIFGIVSEIAKDCNRDPSSLVPIFENFRFIGFEAKSST